MPETDVSYKCMYYVLCKLYMYQYHSNITTCSSCTWLVCLANIVCTKRINKPKKEGKNYKIYRMILLRVKKKKNLLIKIQISSTVWFMNNVHCTSQTFGL